MLKNQKQENLLKDPAKYLKAYGKEINGVPWHGLPPGKRTALVNKKWPMEIQMFKEKINILEGILNNRPPEI